MARLSFRGLVAVTLGAVAGSGIPLSAVAQSDVDDPHYEAEVWAPNPEPERIDETPGFAVTIDSRVSAERVTDVARLIEASPGVSTRSLGGLGTFATVSIRGAAANQVLVLLDGVPLGSAMLQAANVNAVSPSLLDRIEVYRSGAPLALGVSPTGGVVNLVTRDEPGEHLQASASYGSLRTRAANALFSLPFVEPRWDVLFGLSYRGSEGDFDFLDDRGTPFNAGDDSIETRRNNSYDEGDLLARARFEPNPTLTLTLQETAEVEERGIPGLGQNQSRSARFEHWRSITSLRLEALAWPGAATDQRVRLIVDLLRDRFDDPQGEVGLRTSQDVHTRATVFGGQWQLAAYLGTVVELDWTLDGRYEGFETDDRRSGASDRDASRRDRWALSPALAAQLRLLDDHLQLSLGGRYDRIHSQIEAATERDDDLLSGQLGWRLGTASQPLDVYAQGTLRRSARVPSLLEMFGNSGSAIGNAALRSESVLGGDLGVGLDWSAGPLERVSATVAVFSYRYDNLIQFVQNSQRIARPENIAAARIDGLETALTVSVGQSFSGHLAYTLTHAVDESAVVGQAGRPLPGRPEHELHAAGTAQHAGLSLTYRLDVESENTLDRAGFRVVPDRAFHGLELSYRPPFLSQWRLTLEAHNLLDQRTETVPLLPTPPGGARSSEQPVADFLGFPLPGRVLFATVAWELGR